MKKVAILLEDGVYSSSIHGIIETFLLKNSFLAKKESNLSTPNIITASKDGKPVKDSYGENFYVEKPINDIMQCDFIIIPGIEHNSINKILHNSISSDTKEWLKYSHSNGTTICSHYTSIFILGESGLLNGKRCICTQDMEETVTEQYPLANIVKGPDLLLDQEILTTTMATSWISIAYFILYEKSKTEINNKDIDHIASQKVDVLSDIFPYINNSDSVAPDNNSDFVIQAEQVIRNSDNIKIAQLADAMNISPRTLHRRLGELTSESPKEFIDKVKVNYACELLVNSNKKIMDIAATTGFYNNATFRKVFSRYMGLSPSQYRSCASSHKQNIAQEPLEHRIALTPCC